MAKFQLLSGTHDTGTGDERKTYRFDDPENNVVESDKPLDKLFKNKFKRIGGKTEAPRDHDNTLNESGRQGDDPEHLKQAAGRIAARKPKAATLEESPKPQRSKPTDPGYDEDHEAEILDEDEEADATPKRGRKSKAAAEGDDEETGVAGDDVTEDFEGAADAGLTVHKDADAKVFRLARDGKQVGRDLKNKTEAKKALKAEIDKGGDEDEE